jgi:hypothetical protein
MTYKYVIECKDRKDADATIERLGGKLIGTARLIEKNLIHDEDGNPKTRPLFDENGWWALVESDEKSDKLYAVAVRETCVTNTGEGEILKRSRFKYDDDIIFVHQLFPEEESLTDVIFDDGVSVDVETGRIIDEKVTASTPLSSHAHISIPSAAIITQNLTQHARPLALLSPVLIEKIEEYHEQVRMSNDLAANHTQHWQQLLDFLQELKGLTIALYANIPVNPAVVPTEQQIEQTKTWLERMSSSIWEEIPQVETVVKTTSLAVCMCLGATIGYLLGSSTVGCIVGASLKGKEGYEKALEVIKQIKK